MGVLNYDEYGEVVNGEDTYRTIADHLTGLMNGDVGKSVIVGWSDGDHTHLDILFTYTALRFGSQIQGGLRPAKDLFVSIMRMGAFGFDPEHTTTAAGYYDEKLTHGNWLGEKCGEKFAELINGVKRHLV